MSKGKVYLSKVSGGKGRKRWVVADFETTGLDGVESEGRSRVWLYAVCDDCMNIVENGTDIDSFMDLMSRLANCSVCYFHNLKFDGSFLLCWLLEHDFPWSDPLVKGKKGYNALIDDMGSFYTIRVNFENGKSIEFRDSLKLLPMKVSALAKAFGFEREKGTIDYHDYRVDDKTLDYVNGDVLIVANALRYAMDEGINRLTIGSSAYNYYMKPLSDEFKGKYFPELDLEWLLEWRNAYRGGRTQVNPLKADKVVEGVYRYDINSMYPYIMAEKPLPYGKPVKCDRPGKYGFELYKIEVGFAVKPGCMPSLLKKAGLYSSGDSYYVSTDGEKVTLWVTSLDFKLLERNYDLYGLRFLEIWGFPTLTGMFRRYVSHWKKVKDENVGAKRQLAKFMLNSLYGKFGTNPVKESKQPYLKEDGSLGFLAKKDKPGRLYYLPIALAITSWAHVILDDAIRDAGPDNFVYCDTDSVHTLKKLPEGMVDPAMLGKFKLEAVEEKAKYVRQKCYLTKEGGRLHLTCAGMSDSMKESVIAGHGETLFDTFTTGFRCKGKLLPKKVKGGTILYETTFEIR